MFLVENILNQSELKEIKEVMDKEIENNLCLTATLYQSWPDVHLKIKSDSFIKILKKVKESIELIDGNYILERCWFNICRKNSNFDFHEHQDIDISCVFYVCGCQDMGTIFKFNNVLLQSKVNDNSFLFFDPKLTHSIPEYKNHDRYSISFDFIRHG
jgi:hypothetical protein